MGTLDNKISNLKQTLIMGITGVILYTGCQNTEPIIIGEENIQIGTEKLTDYKLKIRKIPTKGNVIEINLDKSNMNYKINQEKNEITAVGDLYYCIEHSNRFNVEYYIQKGINPWHDTRYSKLVFKK